MKFLSWNVNGIRAVITKGFYDVVNKYKPIKHIPTANHIDQCIIFLKNIFKIIGTIGTYNAVIKAALETSLFNKAIC